MAYGMYCKLFASLYQGTLRGASHEILVFTNLLAHADRHGVVDKHFRAIAEETGLTLDEVKAAILTLESPDPESRSPDEAGARIVRMDEHRVWGWRVVNYGKYRAIRSEDDRAGQNRLAQERGRNKNKPPSAKDKQDKPMQKEKEKQQGEEEYKGGVVEVAWNELNSPFKKLRLPLSSGRRVTVRARLAEPQWRETWREALSVLPQLNFMCGRNDRGWVADFDFFIRPDSVAKILEGKYNNGTHQRANTESNRNVGTANEGKSVQYRGVGRLPALQDPKRSGA